VFVSLSGLSLIEVLTNLCRHFSEKAQTQTDKVNRRKTRL
jgi:hypothetical protein